MSKTAIKDNWKGGHSIIAAPSLSVDEHDSAFSDLDSDTESILSDFSDLDNSEGLQPQQQVGFVIQAAAPGQRISPKKTRTERKY